MKKIFHVFLLFACTNSVFAEGANLFTNDFSRIKLTLLSTFLFLVPILLWNRFMTSKLPMDHFSKPVPKWLDITENVFRMAFMFYPFLLPIETGHGLFVPGIIVYTAGLLLYFGSWAYLTTTPDSSFGRSVLVRFAPVYTPIIWSAGMAMMSRSLVIPLLAVPFLGFHLAEYVIRYNK
ncbi:MAG: hypothetical protein JW874_05600 [Spirochaetales bacterium]|nr:hypothetical protein [Spirochaetales bacterium]